MGKRVTCVDGFSLSVDAGSGKYSCPEVDGAEYYTDVQIAYPSSIEEILTPYAQDGSSLTSSVYGWVPGSTVLRVLDKHGGIVSGDLPPLG